MYKVIYADPPWSWKAYSQKGEGRSAKNHYSVMRLEDIMGLRVHDIADEDAVLLLWAIDPMLPQALAVMAAWGFEFKTVGFYWVKENAKSPGFFTGLGYYTRANPEQCLLGTRGKGVARVDKSVRKLVVAPRREHSRKPDVVRHLVERLFGDVPRVELFARDKANGWDVWGNEVVSDVSFGDHGA